MSKDLIDRNKLLSKLRQWPTPEGSDFVTEEDILSAPAVHPEVRRGKWIVLDECSNEGVYCSVCHKKVYKVDYAWSNRPVKMMSNFCPNCGAKMEKCIWEGNLKCTSDKNSRTDKIERLFKRGGNNVKL